MTDLRSLADDLASTTAEQSSNHARGCFDRVESAWALPTAVQRRGRGIKQRHEDLDEPGIDIYARPPGKRIGSLAHFR